MRALQYVVIATISVMTLCATLSGSTSQPIAPYEQTAKFEPANQIDELVLESLTASGLEPAGLCSDAVFIRRVYLDVIGKLPKPNEVRSFTRDKRRGKRAQLIDKLLERDEFADYWSMKWCDVLRVKAEHPINLWPNGVQAYHRWVHHSIATNKPYDQFARELLTSSGSNFRVPQVNFYRAIQGESPSSIAAAVGLTFMGQRIETWSDDDRAKMEVFFSYVAYKPTAEWKEQIIYLDPTPRPAIDAVLPDGSHVRIEPDTDPRQVFADWLIRAGNKHFTATISDRVWTWLMGHSICLDSPASQPALLAYLQKELIKSHYDLKHMYRLVLNSRTYQQSSIPGNEDLDAAEHFAAYQVRRLEAEVLIDALVELFGPAESYESPIPEPFTYVPESEPTVSLADGSITSPFLEQFGRPSRDTGLLSERSNESTVQQRLHMLNSSHIQKKIETSWRLNQLMARERGNRGRLINELYLMTLSRPPTDAEKAAAKSYLNDGDLRQGVNDLAWALINCKEFLYRH